MHYRHMRGAVLFPVFLLVLMACVVIAGAVAFMKIAHANPFAPGFYEEAPPSITWVEEPNGLGSDPVELKATVGDTGGGLDEVLVRISQKNQPQELLRINFENEATHEKEIAFTVDPKALTLREGNAELQIVAFDKTLWSNAATLTKILKVDFLKPRIDVVTPEQNGVIGGTELVFYKVVGKKPVAHGVLYENTLYSGFPAKLLNDSFKSYDTLYFALFPIPLTFSDETKLKIMARDDIGNVATAHFNYRVRHRRWSSVKLQLTPESATRVRDGLAAYAHSASLQISLPGNLIGDLKTLLKALHLQDEGILSEALSKTDGRRWGEGPFTRPVASYPASTLGDQRSIFLGDEEVVRETLNGARFALPSRSNVSAVGEGRIAFTGTLGLLGETVVIDHGFGLATIYGHLSEISSKLGDQVSAGSAIGRSGTSGLSQSEEVYFEVRLHDVPVSPTEWWDATWVRDHIDNKVSFVQRALIGAPGE